MNDEKNKDESVLFLALGEPIAKNIYLNYCCSLMTEFINDERIPVEYFPYVREYAISRIEDGAMSIVKARIFYCPWCGASLPTSLRDEFFDILEAEYEDDRDNLPAEFKTDEWWKKRNL